MHMRRAVVPIGLFLGLFLPSLANADHLVAFITSAQGPGDLSTWADAGGSVGIEAGDAICQSRAAAADLAHPADFVAWLSDSGNDAYCRIHGLTGTVANNCGEAELPNWAGPWVRTDGYPLAGSVDELTADPSVLMTTLNLDENRLPVSASTVFTGTTGQGFLSFSDDTPCGDWALNSSDSVSIGAASFVGSRWSLNGTGNCNVAKPIYCFQVGIGDPLPDLPMAGALAFTTAATGPGRLQDWADAGGFTGVEAGDAICRARATAAGFANPDQFVAWLSDDQHNAVDRFAYEGPWIRPDGVPVAASVADLTDGDIFAPLNLDDQGVYWGAFWVWSGTSESGLSTTSDCDHWSSDADSAVGTRGFVIANNDVWSDSWDGPCDDHRALYCFAQIPHPSLVFLDGFESGNLDRWEH